MAEQHGKTLVPQIRFAGFTDPWEQRKLGDVARRVTRKNENRDSDLPLTISAQYGLVDQRTFFNNQVASKDMSGYFLLHKGEFAYNKSTSTDSPWGAIKRLEKYDMGCVSTLYICFELLSGDPDFLVTYYETDRWYKAVQLIAAEGARNHGLLNIAPDDFFETQICIPKRIDEQRQIGAFFDRLDSLITLHQRKYDKLCVLKKSMLDKMFPKGGSLYPEIRFAGFTDPWEQRKLGELTEIKDSARIPNRLWREAGVPYIRASDISQEDLRGALFIDEEDYAAYKAATGAPEKGDVLFNGGGEIGKAIINGNSSPIYVQGGAVLYARIAHSSLLDARYLVAAFVTQNVVNAIGVLSAGGTMKHFTLQPAKNLPIEVPSIAEQRQIGAFFDRLDSLITLHQRKLELLRNIKKSMLDKMFV
ncbi:restriction endonuclease subunit S [Bifidobacterium adolescentis]|uniref:restriction endonuclease subunit S n=1 Tax=Bifidobacterium adolescentis TaxID=1680 RepID=UPI0034A4E33B